eukprot:648990-Pleurochrysis_carterae.AAC.3
MRGHGPDRLRRRQQQRRRRGSGSRVRRWWWQRPRVCRRAGGPGLAHDAAHAVAAAVIAPLWPPVVLLVDGRFGRRLHLAAAAAAPPAPLRLPRPPAVAALVAAVTYPVPAAVHR